MHFFKLKKDTLRLHNTNTYIIIRFDLSNPKELSAYGLTALPVLLFMDLLNNQKHKRVLSDLLGVYLYMYSQNYRRF